MRDALAYPLVHHMIRELMGHCRRDMRPRLLGDLRIKEKYRLPGLGLLPIIAGRSANPVSIIQ